MYQVTGTIHIQQSQVWQTNTGIISRGDRVILVDPGVLASELDALTDALRGREIVAGFATHFHWDHILWAPGLGAAPRHASSETCRLVAEHRARLLKSLDRIEQQLAAEQGLGPQWDRSVLFDLYPMDLGAGTIAGVACELIDIPGHADGQTVLLLPEDDVAFVADTLSDVETPSLAEGNGQLERYLATLDRLQGVIDRMRWIVPGHGAVADRAEAQRRLDADRRYLEHLPAAVAAAPAGHSDEDLARAIAADLDETRAGDGLSWDMHLENVRMLRAEAVGSPG